MIIYKTTNLINGKIYIGQYKGKSKKYLGSGSLLKKAIEKYGKENFVRETLEDNIDNQEKLNEREIYWIAYYRSMERGIGYNLAVGGVGNISPTEETRQKMSESRKGEKHPMFGRHHTKEARKKISEANRGKKYSEDRIKAMSISFSGENNPFFGRHHTEESKKKNSDTNKIVQSGENNGMYGKVHKESSKDKMREWWEQHGEEQGVLSQGAKPNRLTSSSYVGVAWHKHTKKWVARISFKKHRYFLGYFHTEEEAALAYNKKAIELYGENARLNNVFKNNQVDEDTD